MMSPEEISPVARNREGSPMVSADLNDRRVTANIGIYFVELLPRLRRYQEKMAPWQAPELGLSQPAIEERMLKSFVEQGGKLNFWDFAADIAAENNGRVSEEFDGACARFVGSLGLEVTPVPPAATE